MLSIEIKEVRSNSGFSGLRNSDAREPQGRARERKEKLTLRPRNEVRPLWRVIWRISNNDRGRCLGVFISVSSLKYKQVRDYKKVSIIRHDFQRISNVLIPNNYIRCPFETVAFFNRTPWTAERRHDNQNKGTQGAEVWWVVLRQHSCRFDCRQIWKPWSALKHSMTEKYRFDKTNLLHFC